MVRLDLLSADCERGTPVAKVDLHRLVDKLRVIMELVMTYLMGDAEALAVRVMMGVTFTIVAL